MPTFPARKSWTRVECEEPESAGLLEREHLELVQGELINRSGRSRPELNAQHSLYLWVLQVFGFCFVLQNEPIDVAAADNPINEPVPEVVVINREFQTFVSDNPGPNDIRLLVEVAHSSLTFDLTTKAALYARAGIVEYWVLDVESVAPLAAPDTEFPVRSAFS